MGLVRFRVGCCVMDAEEIFILVVPAMLLLLAAGAFAGAIERIAYNLASGATDLSSDATANAQAEYDYNQRRAEFVRLRDIKADLDSQINLARKERAKLQDQERRLADREKNLVAEAGYPSPAGTGFLLTLEGPAAAMPFAGPASIATDFGGRRRVRLVVWASGMAEAEAVAMNWGGTDAKLVSSRPFSGTVFWHEV